MLNKNTILIPIIYYFIVIAIQSQCLFAFARAADSDIQKFQAEYGKAATRIENHYGRLRGTCKLSRQVNVNSNKRLTDDAAFNIDHGIRKVSILRSLNLGEKGERPEFVYCVAPDYSFAIVRRPYEKSFDVRGIGSDESDIVSYNNKFGRFLSAPFSIYGKPLSEIIAIESFKILTAEEVKPDQFELEYLIGFSTSNDRVKLVLDPSRGWVIKSGQIFPGSLNGRVRIEFQVEYQDGGPIPLPKRVKYLEPTGLESLCDFTEMTTGPTNPNEFQMTYYGLPEMTRSGRTFSRSGITILTALALFSGILGVVLRSRYLRSMRRSPISGN